MKRILLIIIAFLCITAIGLYFYTYKGHRDIAAEDADYTVSVPALLGEFAKGNTEANAKYLDKTIAVKGFITAIEPDSHSIVMDGKLTAQFIDTVLPALKMNQQVKIKGRFIGYDDLLEEFRMDQAIIAQ